MTKILPFLSRSASLFLLTSILIAAPLLGNYQSALAQGTADTAPPDTTITSSIDGNGKPVSSKGTTSSNSITFTYRGTDSTGSVSNFQCSLDNRPFASCGSQINYPSLTDGGHSFSIVAIDSSGNVDKSPAFFTWVVDSAIGSDSNTADPKVTQRAEINAGGLELGQRSLQAASDIPCDSTYCITEGESLTLTYTCSSDFPQAQLKCVMISGPPGAQFGSTEGNPATGTLTWTNAGPPGTYSIKIQAVFTVCPAGITCEDSAVLTETITVLAVNHPPVANAGPDQTVTSDDTVTLDGSASSDADDDPLKHLWSQIAGTPSVNLNNPSIATPTFTAPTVDETTTLTFQLMVNDGTVDSEVPDTVDVVIEPGCGCGDEGTSLAASSSSGKEEVCKPQEKEGMTKIDPPKTYEYPVKGSSLAQVQFLPEYQGVSLEGRPGMTHIHIEPKPIPNKGFVDCKTTAYITITKVIPKYNSGMFDKLSPAAQAEWKRFLEKLHVHEDGHVAGAQQFFQGFGEKLIDKNRSEVKNFVNEQLALYKLNVADPYDASNKHGASQGAVLNTGCAGC